MFVFFHFISGLFRKKDIAANPKKKIEMADFAKLKNI